MDGIVLLRVLDSYRKVVERGVFAAGGALDKEGAEQLELWQTLTKANQ